MTEYTEFYGFTHELIDYSVPVDDLVPCKVCDDTGTVIGDGGLLAMECPCSRDASRRPCDPLCRCSGGPL